LNACQLCCLQRCITLLCVKVGWHCDDHLLGWAAIQGLSSQLKQMPQHLS
jgi:hypothetical protein